MVLSFVRLLHGQICRQVAVLHVENKTITAMIRSPANLSNNSYHCLLGHTNLFIYTLLLSNIWRDNDEFLMKTIERFWAFLLGNSKQNIPTQWSHSSDRESRSHGSFRASRYKALDTETFCNIKESSFNKKWLDVSTTTAYHSTQFIYKRRRNLFRWVSRDVDVS